ncbi:MAG: folylpolyglutamate synthase/dihydrofolate synthase family protein [Tissierellia bacterium]|nr:folylpolyglutamate synthase/dihydrofolate synthase family protein [Tissierellia bacterium]
MNWKLYIDNKSFMRSNLSLDNLKRVLEVLDNPQDKVKMIHVAGTNGKGTTCRYIYDILRKHGYNVGLYTSPHIHIYNERIEINGNYISDYYMEKFTKTIIGIEEKENIFLSKFEFLTVIAFLYFRNKCCDYAVIEVGMGGRFDATNVIEKPAVSVITNIGLDHTKYLGNTIKKIAFEKAGIIKENTPVVCYDLDSRALPVIEKEAYDKGANLYVSDFDLLDIKKMDLDNSIFDYKNFNDIKIKLLGKSAIYNACVAIDAINLIFDNLNKDILYKALENTTISYRFQNMGNNIIFDVSHNEQSVKSMISNLNLYFKDKSIIFVYGILSDKNYIKVTNLVKDIGDRFYLTKPYNKRALDPLIISKILKNKDISIIKDPTKAINSAILEKNSNEAIIVFGSFYNYRSKDEL